MSLESKVSVDCKVGTTAESDNLLTLYCSSFITMLKKRLSAPGATVAFPSMEAAVQQMNENRNAHIESIRAT